MRCKLCEQLYREHPLIEREHYADPKKTEWVHQLGKNYFSSAVQCAFESGEFSNDNWGCRTMHALRDLCGESDGNIDRTEHGGTWWRDDMLNASLGVFPIPEGVADTENMQYGYLVMSWYKSRGRTGRAYVLNDDDEVQNLTLETAECILKTIENGGGR